MAGRLLVSADDYRGCPRVTVLGHGPWQRGYGGARLDPMVVCGRTRRTRATPRRKSAAGRSDGGDAFVHTACAQARQFVAYPCRLSPSALRSRVHRGQLTTPHAPVAESTPDIVVLTELIASDTLRTLLDRFFEDMVKYVVDVERGIAAVGGELHADAEALLLEDGSRQQDLWGANYYPGRGPDECIEYTSLINIRPAQGNRSMEVEDREMRERVRETTFRLIGRGEALP